VQHADWVFYIGLLCFLKDHPQKKLQGVELTPGFLVEFGAQEGNNAAIKAFCNGGDAL